MSIGGHYGMQSQLIMARVFVNGCFDLLHPGHIALLNYAKSLGDNLLVAIDSDQRVQQHKGQDRPINDQTTRSMILENLKAVDQVKIFSSDQELIDIIKAYQPDIMVVGSDWQNKKVLGSEYSQTLKFFNRINDESTTKIIESYVDRRQLR